MTASNLPSPGSEAARYYGDGGSVGGSGRAPANLGDILERVLDKGLVIAGDIQVNLLDIELLTIKLRLVIASLETAREVGINWWESDPWLNADAARRGALGSGGNGTRELREENRRLHDRIRELESDELEPDRPAAGELEGAELDTEEPGYAETERRERARSARRPRRRPEWSDSGEADD